MGKKKNLGGRPPKLRTVSARNRFLGFLRKGVSIKAACSLSGICHLTFRKEVLSDPEFAQKVAAAEDHARGKLEQTFFKAGSGKEADWKAAEKFLSRKYYEDWAQRKPDSIEVRQLARQLPALVAIVLEFTTSEKHDELRQRIDRWLENLLADDRNA